jgi:hypothetical protein
LSNTASTVLVDGIVSSVIRTVLILFGDTASDGPLTHAARERYSASAAGRLVLIADLGCGLGWCDGSIRIEFKSVSREFY